MKTSTHLFFDIDGTLWDSTEKVAEAFNSGIIGDPRVADSYPITADKLKAEFGLPLHVIGRHLFPTLSEPESDRLTDYLCDLEVAYLREHTPALYPGVAETVQALAEKHHLYIVSNCQAGYAEAFLESTGLEPYFRDHLCPGDSGLLKADNISLLMAKYDIPEAYYIGDTDGDRLSAREAGVRFIFAAYGFGQVPEADEAITSFADLNRIFLQEYF